MATSVNISPLSGSAPGANPIVNEVGDLWSITLVGSLPGNVATSTTFYYRQASSFSATEDPAADLNAAFMETPGVAWELLRLLLSDSFQVDCTIVRNLSQDKAFTNTFAITGGEGVVLTGEVVSSNTVVRLRYMDEAGNSKARKVIYLPGVDQSFISDSKIVSVQLPVANAFIDSLYTLTGAIGLWSWQYTQDPTDPDTPAANGHIACFIGRLKSRSPALC